MASSEEIRSLLDIAIESNRKEMKTEMEEQLEAQRVRMEERVKYLLQGQLENGASVRMKEDFDDSPTPPVDQNESKFFAAVARNHLGVNKYEALSDINTGTVTMFVVAEVVNKNGSFRRKLFFSLCGLVFAFLQYFALALVMTESSSPMCYSMADCPSGTFCEIDRFKHPSCVDCRHIFIDQFIINTTITNNECQNLDLPTSWKDLELVDIDHIEMHVTSNSNSTLLRCYSFKHCLNSDMNDVNDNFKGNCDFLTLNMSKMDGRIWILMVFLGLLWALPVITDMEEAAIEEIILDHHLAGSLLVPAEIVRLALRIRRLVIPFVATSTLIVLLVTDEISAKNIILNFLAITFIQEADNIVAQLFLRTDHKELMDKTVENLDIESLFDSSVFFWTRLQGLYCLIAFIIGVLNVESVVDDCTELSLWLDVFWIFTLCILLFLQGCYKAFIKKYEETTSMQIFCALNDFFRNIMIIVVLLLSKLAIYKILIGDRYLVNENDMSIGVSIIIFSFISIFIVLEIFRWVFITPDNRQPGVLGW